MKKINFLTTLILLSQVTYSQIVSADIGDEFKEMSKFSSRQTGFEGIQTYSSGIVNGSQFFSPSWSTGEVTTITNETIGKNYYFLFDKVRQELFMKWKDSSVIFLPDKNQISSFILNTDKAHYFVPASGYDPSDKGNFFEVLTKSAKGYTLLKLIKTKFVKGDERDIEKQRLGEIYDSFEDQVTYYVSFDNSVAQPIALKEKSIKKVLASSAAKVEEYFKNHTKGSIDETFLSNLIQYIDN